MGIQWPAALIKRKSDDKILNVSRKTIHVYESAYLSPLDQRMEHVGDVPTEMKMVTDDFNTLTKGGVIDNDTTLTEGGVIDNDTTLTEGGVIDHNTLSLKGK